MDPGRIGQSVTQAEWVRQLPSQLHPVLRFCDCLIRIAKQPQRPGRNGPAAHPRVMPAIEKSMVPVLLGIVQREALLQVRLSRGKLAETEQGGPLSVVSF